jgi:O-antigen ligase
MKARPLIIVTFPWESLIFPFILTLLGIQFLGGKLPGEAFKGNEVVSTLVLVVVAIATYLHPARTLELFLALQLPAYLLSNSGAVGNEMVSYVSFVIAVVLLFRKIILRKTLTPFPGTGLSLALCGLAVLQWFRAAQLLDTLPLLMDIVSFCIVLAAFNDPRMFDFRRLRLSFVFGMAVSAVLVLTHEFPFETRVGYDLGLNANYFGHMAGFALLLASSIRTRLPFTILQWVICGILGLLLVLSESRMAIFGFGCCFLLLFLLERKYFQFALSALAVVVSVLIVSHANLEDYQSISYRLASPFVEGFESSGAMRASIWAYLLTMIKQYWVFGVGLGNIPLFTAEEGLLVYGQGLQSHNIYLTLLLEFGFSGFLLVVLWQLRMLAYGKSLREEGALGIAMLVYMILEGFFSGMNLSFFTAIVMVISIQVKSHGHPMAYRLLAGKTRPRAT